MFIYENADGDTFQKGCGLSCEIENYEVNEYDIECSNEECNSIWHLNCLVNKFGFQAGNIKTSIGEGSFECPHCIQNLRIPKFPVFIDHRLHLSNSAPTK